MLGRGLIGLGVSGCMMSAFKAFSEWLPAGKLPLANSFIQLAGGLGGLFATRPAELALHHADWRILFIGLSGVTLLTAMLVYSVPPRKHDRPRLHKSAQLGTLLKIMGNPSFQRFVPLATTIQATYLAILSLWIGPWFRDVVEYSSDATTTALLLISMVNTAGYLANGIIADTLSHWGIHPTRVCIAGMVAFQGGLGLILFMGASGSSSVWFPFAFFAPFCLIAYPLLSSLFPGDMGGRVITLYNLLVFLFSSIIQWGMGIVIDLYPVTAAGGYSPAGQKTALFAVLLVNFAATGWMVIHSKGQLPGLPQKTSVTHGQLRYPSPKGRSVEKWTGTKKPPSHIS